ncbi:hypothetical protein SLE2022_230900 [Rubroshorea leprosula]
MAESNVQDLIATLGKRLPVMEEEDVGLDLDGDCSLEQARRISSYCLVGMGLIQKHYDIEAMVNMLARVWRLVKGLHMRILGHNLFAFYIFHSVDMQLVMVVGLWHFANHVITLKEAQGGGQVACEDLFEVLF